MANSPAGDLATAWCTLDEAVHDTEAHLATVSGRHNLQLAIACYSQATQKTSTCNHCRLKTRHAALNNHDARRDDDATYRKTRKNSKRLRAPTTRTEVRLVSRERVEGGS